MLHVSNGQPLPPSVRLIEGTVNSLLEEDGCVTGVQYRDKDSGELKVSSGEPRLSRGEAAFSRVGL